MQAEGCREFTIGVTGNALEASGNRLFSALASLFPVKFRPVRNGYRDGLDALILASLDPEIICHAATDGLPVLAVPSSLPLAASARETEFRFSDSAALDACLRGQHFQDTESLADDPLATASGDEVLASQGGRAVWLRRRMGGAAVTMVKCPLPDFAASDHVYEKFQSDNFFRLLPLLQFLHDVTEPVAWQSPQIPACLLIDDPSLYSKRYGHLDFNNLAMGARQEGFYASIATVPLDSWWINRQTRTLLCENAPRISVLPHGNNHTHRELAYPASDDENLSLLAQALQRTQRLEQNGLEVCRVMECPHGSLSFAMLEPMARLGYEAAFASIDHLMECNRGVALHPSLGGEQTFLQRNAVPIIPRIRTVTGWQTQVRLAAFLQQPLVLALHHWDFAGGSSVPGDFAQIVNSLPGVRWATPTGVARACYHYRQTGDVLHLKLDSRLVDVPLPPSVESLMIYRPWLHGAEESELLSIRAGGDELVRAESSADVLGPIYVRGRSHLQVSSTLLEAVDFHSVPPPRFQYWPLVRKLMMEFRDRTRLHVQVPHQLRFEHAPMAHSRREGKG